MEHAHPELASTDQVTQSSALNIRASSMRTPAGETELSGDSEARGICAETLKSYREVRLAVLSCDPVAQWPLKVRETSDEDRRVLAEFKPTVAELETTPTPDASVSRQPIGVLRKHRTMNEAMTLAG